MLDALKELQWCNLVIASCTMSLNQKKQQLFPNQKVGDLQMIMLPLVLSPCPPKGQELWGMKVLSQQPWDAAMGILRMCLLFYGGRGVCE